MSDVIVAPETRDLAVLARQIEQWLAGRLKDASEVRVTDLAYPRGAGQSHETILFDAGWTEAGVERGQGYVLRIKPKGFTVFPDNLFEQQYAIMAHLAESGRVRVARPLYFEDDAGLLGNPFFIMEKVEGRVPVSIPPYARSGWVAEASADERRVLWQSAVEQLALIQTVPVDDVPFLAGHGEAARGLAQEWDKYVRFTDWLEEVEPQPVLRAGLARLESLWPEHQPEGIVWGDARIGNMMFGPDFKVRAVMDWEQPSLGGALHDLAWFVTLAETMHGRSSQHGAYLEGMGSREETIALWENVSGKSAKDLDWYEDFARFKMTCTGVRLGHLRGQPMMDQAAMAARLKVG